MNSNDRGNPGREDEDERGPVDADIALITDYLARALSPEESAAVEHRLKTDIAFYKKVAPVVKIWTMPVNFRERLARAEAESASEAAPAAKAVPQAPEAQAAVPPRGMVGEPAVQYEFVPKRTFRDRLLSGVTMSAKTAYAIAAVVALFVGIPTVQYLRFSGHRQREGLGTQGVPTFETMPRGIAFETPAGPPRAVRFGDGSFVTLGPRSRFTYQTGLPGTGLKGELDGEATIEVSKSDGMLFLKTSWWRALLTKGTYAVSCEIACAEVLITVGTGNADVQGDSATAKVPLSPGQFGRIPRGGAAERTSGGEGYPTITLHEKSVP
jgi:hypothetical protein